jgi:4-hydroxy-2-oxoheptanedioate aldolase
MKGVPMTMRPSRVLRKLRAGMPASCTKLNLIDARAAEIACQSGFDCLWYDNEHTSMDWRDLEHAIRAAKVYDADALVRVSRGGYSDYIRPLELDAAGIMVPHLMSAADARSVARMTRFHPVGRRPVDGGNADGAYCRIDFNSYLEQANRERFVIVQIEDPEPMAELEAIAAVPGIDMLFFGPGDFSHGIGKPGQWDAPEIAAARKSIALAARKHGKFAGTVSDAAGIRERLDLGYRFISVGADVVALEQYWDDVAKAFSDNGFGK